MSDSLSSSTPDALPLTARALYRRLLWIAMAYGFAAIVASVLLIVYGLDMTQRQLLYGLAIGTFVVGPTVLTVDIVVLNRHFRPIRKYLEDAASGRVDGDAAQQALIQLLNLPLLTLVRILGFHGPAGIISGTIYVIGANAILGTGYQTWQVVAMWSSFFVTIAAHAILEYYAVNAVVRPLVPIFRVQAGELSPEQSRRIIPVNIRQRLLALSIWMAFIPLVVLGFTMMVRANNLLAALGVADTLPRLMPMLLWGVILIALVTLVTIRISFLMARDVSQLAGDMVGAMRRVEEGDLESYLEIVSTDEFATLYQGFNRMTHGLEERERLRDAFGRYVAPEVAEQVLRDGVQLGGETVTATVLFADIRGFTSLAEKMAAPQVVALLNRYFAAVGPAIEAEGGWINKFGGDSLLAVFGAPVPRPDHAHRAVCAALAMRAALAEFNARQRASGGPELRIGVGIDCGEMVAGSVGSPDRMEYTVIGDTVNTASRIEALNKDWQTDILISDGVYQALRGQVEARPMPLAEVRGKSELVQVYAVT